MCSSRLALHSWFMISIGDENWAAISMRNTLQNWKHGYDFDSFFMICEITTEQQGSRLKADYVVTWDKDGFFRNSRNQPQEKNNAVIAADHYRSEAPRRQVYNSRHSPDRVRPRRFKVRFRYFKGYIFICFLWLTSWTICIDKEPLYLMQE